MKRNTPHWGWLASIGLVSGGLLVEEINLPFSPAVDSWLLGLWVLLFYGAVAIWITRNREMLEREPEPRDCVGRPIIESGLTTSGETPASPETREKRPGINPFSQSEAM